jgi:hypothetical protein
MLAPCIWKSVGLVLRSTQICSSLKSSEQLFTSGENLLTRRDFKLV